jgi:hypothetical protein
VIIFDYLVFIMTLTARKLRNLYEIKQKQVEKKEREIEIKREELATLGDAISSEQEYVGSHCPLLIPSNVPMS